MLIERDRSMKAQIWGIYGLGRSDQVNNPSRGNGLMQIGTSYGGTW